MAMSYTTELKGIRIVSDGSVMGTRVFDADGKDVTGSLYIRSIKWTHNAGGVPTAELSCLLSEIEAHVPSAAYDKRWVATETLADESHNYLPIDEIPK